MQANHCTVCGRELAVVGLADNSKACPVCAQHSHLEAHEAISGLDHSDAPTTLLYAAKIGKKRRMFLPALIVLTVGVLGVTVILPMTHRCPAFTPPMICSMNLRGIGQAMYIYAQDYPNGDFPSDISMCVSDGNAIAKQFVCPLSHNPGTSYFYVAGLTTNSNPQSVLMYENPQNHPTQGTAVLFVDGHTEIVKPARLQSLIQQGTATHTAVLVPDLSAVQPTH